MPNSTRITWATMPRDLTAGLVVFLVALPLCLGVALASGAPLLSGVLAGIVGGILIGALSKSHTSVSGPAAGLTAVVSAQIATVGSFEGFLLVVVLAGLMQIGLGIAKAGFIAAYFPSSVIKGLLAAIGVILILKQIPHALGHDADPDGEMSFFQPDQSNTFYAFIDMIFDCHLGASVIGVVSIAMLFTWDKWTPLKRLGIPAPLVVVLLGVACSALFKRLGGLWSIEPVHLVQVPVANSLSEFAGLLQFPDFSLWNQPVVWTAAFTVAAVASLETLLNLEGVDKLDPKQRTSPPSWELLAQGVGNVVAGLVGGLPVTSVIVRSSVNINAGCATKVASVVHGVLLLVSVLFLPAWLNMIPLSSLAAILLVTGLKLASPALVKQMWSQGRYQFVPFALTVVAIVFTDLLVGVIIGLISSIAFVLHSNVRSPLRRIVEKHPGGELVRIELASQVSFLNLAALDQALNDIPRGGHVLLDAQNTDYIDPDVLSLIREYKETTAPVRNIEVSLLGFRHKYQLHDQTQFVDFTTRDLQDALTPEQVIQILKDGHERFRTGQRLTRDLGRQVHATSAGQHPLAVVVSCIDSRAPAELIFDLGLGDIFSVRIAGNITSRKVLGSVEYGCAVAGAKLILVMGHTRCGAVTAAVNLLCSPETAAEATGCQHLEPIIQEIQQSADRDLCQRLELLSPVERESLIDTVACSNVERVVRELLHESETLSRLVGEGRIAVVGAMYDVVTGDMKFLPSVPLVSPR